MNKVHDYIMKSSRMTLTAAIAMTMLVGTVQADLIDLSGQDAIADSEKFGNRTAEQAFDGSHTSENWNSIGVAADTPHWIYVGLGDTYTIEQVNIDWAVAPNGASAYELYVYNGVAAPDPTGGDFSSWTQIATMTGLNGTVNNVNDNSWDFTDYSYTSLNGGGAANVIAASPVVANWLGIRAVNSASNSGSGYEVNLREVEVYGAVVVVPEPSTLGLLAAGLAGMMAARRRTRK